jgi:YYY domain-containing protein
MVDFSKGNPKNSAARLRGNVLALALLVVIFCTATYFRFVGQNWDDFTHLHPDERFLTQVASSLNGPLSMTGVNPEEQLQACRKKYPDTAGVGPFFDSACTNWYAKNVGYGLYVYGELPMMVVRSMAEITRYVHLSQTSLTPDTTDDIIASQWTEYNGIHLVGRSVSAVAELLSLIFVFLTAARLYNKWVGVLAVALAAAAVFPIQLSHFWTTDAFTNLPVMICLYFTVRVMQEGRMVNFALAGMAMGAAIASRINVLPLFGIIFLAAVIYALPALNRRIAQPERTRLFSNAVSGILLAGILMIVIFRFANPHAFRGEGSLGFLDIRPYIPFFEDIGTAQNLVSGKVDMPPNYQWNNRFSYSFPLWNMVAWGMGLPLGLTAWGAVLWATWQILRVRPGWTRHILLVVWILGYFAFMGRQWVMTMRYYMPIYPALIILAAYALWEIFQRASRALGNKPTAVRGLVLRAAPLLLVFVVGFTYLWAIMFTNIYRHQLTRVQGSNWVFRNVPAALSVNVTNTETGLTRLLNVPVFNTTNLNYTLLQDGVRIAAPIIQEPTEYEVDRILVDQAFTLDAGSRGVKKLWASITTDPNGLDIRGLGHVEDTFFNAATLGALYEIKLDRSVTISPAQTYYVVLWSEGGGIGLGRLSQSTELILTNITRSVNKGVALPTNPDFTAGQASAFFTTAPLISNVEVEMDGAFTSVNFAHLLNPLGDSRQTRLRVEIFDANTNLNLGSGRASIMANSRARSPFGDPAGITLDAPVNVKAGQNLRIVLSTEDNAPARITGSVIVVEDGWDDSLPTKTCAIPYETEPDGLPPGQFNVLTCGGVDPWGLYYRSGMLYVNLEESDPGKRANMERVLAEADYLTISSNRQYDTLRRLPMRFPMANAYYETLFSGSLGFDLAAVFNTSFAIGDFKISDQQLPFYNSPLWMNEFEAEEAFHVYDHPAVLIYKKNTNYNHDNTLAMLAAASTADSRQVSLSIEDPTIVGVITWPTLEADRAPSALMMDPALRDIQSQGGTWRDLFDRNAIWNTSAPAGVFVWWLMMLIVGWAVFPILYVLFPALPDRAYPFAKLAGLLLWSWLAWAGGALRLLTWTRVGLFLLLVALIGLSLAIIWRRRREFFEYLSANRRHILIVEAITLALFGVFLWVRLGNPDLWAQTLGGEKPMNFAYFNAVLRSTVFPPVDPWYAGGYMNYYYFGYVLVGAPVKLIGIVPSIAYNLIVPTLFAFTGIAAFSLAFNLVAARWFSPREEISNAPTASVSARRRFALQSPPASPYVAGVLAIVMCVGVGNLTTPTVIASGLLRSGGCFGQEEIITGDLSLRFAAAVGRVATPTDDAMYGFLSRNFNARNQRPPSPEEETQLLVQAASPNIGDRVGLAFDDMRRNVTCVQSGLDQTFKLGYLPGVGTDRWYWASRSVLGELPGNSNEINEFPYFTFLFGDLHAHMIAMPLTYLVLAWLLAEILAAGRVRRKTWIVIGATAFGGLSIGILQATNTWDWITYLVLGMVGVPFAIFLRRDPINRPNLLAWGAQVVGLYIVQVIAAMPFTAFFATSYSAVKPFLGNKTPLWAYFTIHGLFLFVLLALLLWQTRRVLKHLYVRDLIGRVWVVRGILAIAFIFGGATILLGFISVPLSPNLSTSLLGIFTAPSPLVLLLIPLLAWITILLLLPDQPREWQFIYLMLGLAFGLCLGVEFVVLDGDIGRQNTFFKFYVQVWMLLSVAAGVGAAWLLYSARRWKADLRLAWVGGFAILLSMAGLYPIFSTEAKNAMRMAPQAPNTLDGLAYMNDAIYYQGPDAVPLKADLAIITWLQDNVDGTPVIVEAHQYPSEYVLNSRINISTGLPTLLGWAFHQKQQRTLDPLPNLVSQRAANVFAFYNTPLPTVAWRMIEHYHIKYIVVGRLEQITYKPDGLAKFEFMVQLGLLERVYDQDGSKIYKVRDGATLDSINVGMTPLGPTNTAP